MGCHRGRSGHDPRFRMNRAAKPAHSLPPGIVLAGGRSRRMGGGDKALLPLGGQALLAYIVDRIRPQVSILALNANGDASRFVDQHLPVVADTIGGSRGPLAGILTGLEWAVATSPASTHVLTVPCDTPFLPRDLVARLMSAVPGHDLACAASCGRLHGTVGVWPVRMAGELRAALQAGTAAKVGDWLDRYRLAIVDFTDGGGPDPFLNINRREDLAAARRVLEDR